MLLADYLLLAKVTFKDKLHRLPNDTTTTTTTSATTTTTTTTCSLNVSVADDNDNSPVFDSDGGNYAVVLSGGTLEGSMFKVEYVLFLWR